MNDEEARRNNSVIVLYYTPAKHDDQHDVFKLPFYPDKPFRHVSLTCIIIRHHVTILIIQAGREVKYCEPRVMNVIYRGSGCLC